MMIPWETLIGWSANLIQIFSFLFTLLVLWRTRRRMKRIIHRTLASDVRRKPLALAIGINGSIEGQVRAYLQNEHINMEVVAISRQGFIPNHKYYEVLNELDKVKQELTDRGVSEVHLFYKGPVTLAMGIGALLDNWVPVRTYELDKQSGEYRPDLILGKGRVLELWEDLVAEGEQAILERTVS
jgi:hypothetical protein